MVESISRAFQVVAIAILVAGSVYVAVSATLALAQRRSDRRSDYKWIRGTLGRTLLLSLEVFVAADLIDTVSVDQTLESVATLGLLVLVRTVLSVSIDTEIDGMAPWRKAQYSRPPLANSPSSEPTS